MRARRTADQVDPAEVGGVLKERVYVTFTGLAIVLALYTGDEHHRTSQQVSSTLMLGVVGVTLASFASDIISHLAVHRHFPLRRELLTITRGSVGALGSLLIPAVLIACAWLGFFALTTAMLAAAAVYVAELAVVGWLAVHKAELTWQQRALSILILVSIGALVLAVQVLAHS